MDDVADLTAAIGAGRGLAERMDSETIDEFGRFGNGRAIRKMDVILQRLTRLILCSVQPLVAGRRCEFWDGHALRRVNQKGLERPTRSCHGTLMAHPQQGFPRAGGFLLALSILIGPIVGAMFGQPSLGFLIGLGIGLLLLLAVWLADRARL